MNMSVWFHWPQKYIIRLFFVAKACELLTLTNMEISVKRTLVVSLLLTILIWGVQSWPLGKYLGSGIPCSTQNIEKDGVRHMIPGDHLQLLYHFWLFRDMMTGGTPLFHNLYEFNTGEDSERWLPRAYFFPFSFIYAIFSLIFGNAVGWNIASLISLWLTWFFTARLIRRYVYNDWISLVAASVAVVFPWRWVGLMGGSPMGFAMCWIPAYWLGLDTWLRNKSWRGGLLAGLAVLFMSFGDFQTFYFALLSTPVWLLISGLHGRDWSAWSKSWTAGIPLGVLGLLSVGHALMAKKAHAGSALDKHGRDLSEVALASPVWQHFFTWRGEGLEAHAYLGFVIWLLIAVAVVALVLLKDWRMRLTVLLLLTGFIFLILIGLGTNSLGPHGKFFVLVRENLPLYPRIRQPLKAWCLLPTVIALITAFALTVFVSRKSVGLALVALFGVECIMQVRTSVSLLDPANSAYAAIEGDSPHALVIPLWPGDSDQSSIYQYYAMQGRLRMVNGYSPVVKQKYYDEIFVKYRSLNQGVMDEKQALDLLAMGVTHIVLHENAFPEKVSPWPVGVTIRRMQSSPFLQAVKQDGPVHVFQLIPGEEGNSVSEQDGFFASRRYAGDFEKAFKTRPTYIASAPDLRIEAMVRGTGRVNEVSFDVDGQELLSVALTNHPGLVQIDAAGGLGQAVIAAGGSYYYQTNVTLSAGHFYHAGYTVPGTQEVHIRPRWETDDRIFYGPLRPVQPGLYEATLYYRTTAPVGVLLGVFGSGSRAGSLASRSVESPGPNDEGSVTIQFDFPENELLDLSFYYEGDAPLVIERVQWRRLD